MDDDIAISFEKETEPRTSIAFSIDSEDEYVEPYIYSIEGLCLGSDELSIIEDNLREAVNNGELMNDTSAGESYTCSITRTVESLYETSYSFTNLHWLEGSND